MAPEILRLPFRKFCPSLSKAGARPLLVVIRASSSASARDGTGRLPASINDVLSYGTG